MSRKSDEYAAALDQLDRMRAAGQVSSNQYDLKRTELVAEAASRPRSLSVQFLLVVGVIVGLIICVRILIIIVQMN